MSWNHRETEYKVKSFFPADFRKRRECRRVLAETRLDEESGDYMSPLTEARYDRARAHIEAVHVQRRKALEEDFLRRQGDVLQMKQVLAQLEEELDEGEWDDEI